MINADFKYHMPTKIIFGDNKINDLKLYLGDKKTILIISNSVYNDSFINRFKKLGLHIVHVVKNIKSHPEFKNLEEIYNEIYKYDFDQILAIGGGSVIDAAKFFSVYSIDKEINFVSKMIKGKIEKKNYLLKPIISIPTTAGTSSEITPWATIWDMDKKKKYSLHLPNLFSKMAIYDPILTLSVPRKITIQTGLDALSHSLESIWNKNANEITINYAVKAAKLIVEFLPLLANDLNNVKYRANMLKACMYAGLAFSNTQTALAHAMSYYITTKKRIPHGIACSFTLPLLIDNIIGKYDFVDDALREIFGDLSSKKIRNLFDKLEISTDFMAYDISSEDFEELKLSLGNNQRANNSLVNI